MSKLKQPEPVKFIAAVFSREASLINEVASRFEKIAGLLDYASELMAFDHTDYYRKEMGAPLYKRFFAVEQISDPAGLVEIKIQTNRVEEEYHQGDNRTVNIDPGYLAVNRLILATGKDVAHRVYLDKGVWADLSLVYQHGAWKDLPWTYPDYSSNDVKTILLEIRKKYLEQLKTWRRTRT